MARLPSVLFGIGTVIVAYFLAMASYSRLINGPGKGVALPRFPLAHAAVDGVDVMKK